MRTKGLKLFKNHLLKAGLFYFALLAILILGVYLTLKSYPPYLLYYLRYQTQELVVLLTPSHKGKAKIYLGEAVRLQKHLAHLSKTDPENSGIGILSQVLVFQENRAIEEMDEAKNAYGKDSIKNEIEVLCDLLLVQYSNMEFAMIQQANGVDPKLQKSIDGTQLIIGEAQDW